MRERYHITGMTCSACSSHVEKAVSQLKGVEKSSVNLLTETMEVEYNEEQLGEADIVAAVTKAGYHAERMGQPGAGNAAPDREKTREALSRRAQEEDRAMKRRLGLSVAFLVPLMYVAMYHMFHSLLHIPVPEVVMRLFHGNENAMIFAMTQFLLLLPILYLNRRFFTVGFSTLGHLAPNMDSLIAVGASAATGYGLFAMYRIAYGLGHGDMGLVEHYSHDLYFESAGMILTLITVGKYLESRSKGKTGEAITRLMDLSPKTALRLEEDGTSKEVPTESLRVGDIFLVKPGSMVPVDGVVEEGRSSVDESAVTGESIPVEKQPRDKVYSATMNKAGFLKCRAERVGEDTTLSQIVRLVEEAAASKAPIAQLADKVAGVFVPVVMGIALFTLIVWLLLGAETEFAISSAIAVLVISCPCALGLATPVAIMVGTGVGAGNGILIKSGEALQQARDVDTVVLDKTGTVTEGKLRVRESMSFVRGLSAETLLLAAAALEEKSEHPLAEAILKEAEHLGAPVAAVEEFRAVFGRGIQGVLAEEIPAWKEERGDGPTAVIGKPDRGRERGLSAGTRLFLGNRAYMEEQGIELTPKQQEAFSRMADEGETPLFLSGEGSLLGMFGVADVVRASSVEAVRAWKQMGVRVVMLTGDNRRTAEAVCRRMELSEVIAQVLPQDKEKEIRRLKEAGCRVAMIGDGINDAPALAAADVGMAIGAGTDVAIESADIILMKNDLRDAVTAMKLSRRVIRNIKQNLFWAFFYNCIGIPLAAGLWYPLFGVRLTPMFGAAAMSLSSVCVVWNALRLRGFRSGFSRSGRGSDSPAEKPQENKGGKNMTKVITVEGMMCSHCTGRVQKALESVAGVESVTMSLENKTAQVQLKEDVSEDTLRAAVAEAGYEVAAIS